MPYANDKRLGALRFSMHSVRFPRRSRTIPVRFPQGPRRRTRGILDCANRPNFIFKNFPNLGADLPSRPNYMVWRNLMKLSRVPTKTLIAIRCRPYSSCSSGPWNASKPARFSWTSKRAAQFWAALFPKERYRLLKLSVQSWRASSVPNRRMG